MAMARRAWIRVMIVVPTFSMRQNADEGIVATCRRDADFGSDRLAGPAASASPCTGDGGAAAIFLLVEPAELVVRFVASVDGLAPVGIRDGPRQPRAPPLFV
jgi:hypothetical protein